MQHWDENDFDYDDDADICDLCGQTDCTCDECGMMPDGTCSLAGTEHCDWDCTLSRLN